MEQSVENEYEFEPVHLPDFHCDIHLWRDERSIFFSNLLFIPQKICTQLQIPVTKKQIQLISLHDPDIFLSYLDDKPT